MRSVREIIMLLAQKIITMKKIYILVIVAFLMTMVVICQSCSEEKYTVWTETETYSDFQSAFQTTLNDGYYVRVEITNDQWVEISKNLTSEGRHKWDEATIRKWLVSNGFGETEADKESAWLVLVNHGFLVTRDGNLVYMILK